MNSAGLVEYWKKRSSMNIDMCMLGKTKAEGKPKPIKLIELSSAFFVLGVGIALSTVTFLIERFVHFLKHFFLQRFSVTEVWTKVISNFKKNYNGTKCLVTSLLKIFYKLFKLTRFMYSSVFSVIVSILLSIYSNIVARITFIAMLLLFTAVPYEL